MPIPSNKETQTHSDPHKLQNSVAERLKKMVYKKKGCYKAGGELEPMDVGEVTRGESPSEIIQRMADLNKCACLKGLTKASSSSSANTRPPCG